MRRARRIDREVDKLLGFPFASFDGQPDRLTRSNQCLSHAVGVGRVIVVDLANHVADPQPGFGGRTILYQRHHRADGESNPQRLGRLWRQRHVVFGSVTAPQPKLHRLVRMRVQVIQKRRHRNDRVAVDGGSVKRYQFGTSVLVREFGGGNGLGNRIHLCSRASTNAESPAQSSSRLCAADRLGCGA